MIFIGHLLAACATFSVAVLMGATLLRAFRLRDQLPLEQLVLGSALGFAAIGYALFGLGVAGVVSRSASLVLLASAGIVGAFSSRPVLRAFTSILRSVRVATGDKVLAVLAGVFALIAALNVVAASAPPTDWDSIDHHLGAVKHFVADGRVTFLPYRAWQAPFTAEMWNMLGLLLGSERLPQLYQCLVGIVSASALYLIAAPRLGVRTGVLAAVIYYSSPHIFNLSASAKSDLAWLAFVFLSLHCAWRWQETGRNNWLWVSALFAGLTLATKYQGLLWLPGLLLLTAALHGAAWMSSPLRAASRMFVYGMISLLVVSPWWVRNWLAAADPIWPYGYGFFESRFWSNDLHAKYAAWHTGAGSDVLSYLLGPWNLTVRQAAWQFGLTVPISPVLLGFLPAPLLIRASAAPRARFLTFLSIPILVYYTCWFVTYQQTRYLLPALGLMMIVAAHGFWLLVRMPIARWPAIGLLSGSLAMFVGLALIFSLQFLPVVSGRQSRADFLRSKVSFYDDIQWLNASLPANTRILFFHLKTFYLDRPFVRGDRSAWAPANDIDASGLLSMMRQRGITHIFVTDLVRSDSEFSTMERLLGELRAGGHIRTVYRNPHAIVIESRTFGSANRSAAEVLEITYPAAMHPQRRS